MIDSGCRAPLLPRSRAEIALHIPHREPFLFIDEILSFDKDCCARSSWRLTGEEPFFAGHYPGRPILPGVLLLEHMAQTAAFLVAYSRTRPGERNDRGGLTLMLFAGIERARFLKAVHPGAKILTDVSAIKLFATMGLLRAESYVAGEPVARARFSFGALAQG